MLTKGVPKAVHPWTHVRSCWASPRFRRSAVWLRRKGLVRPHRTRERRVLLPAVLNVARTGRLQQGPGRCAESPARTRTYGRRRGGVWPSMRW